MVDNPYPKIENKKRPPLLLLRQPLFLGDNLARRINDSLLHCGTRRKVKF